MPQALPEPPKKAPKPPKQPSGDGGGRPKWVVPAAVAGGVVTVGVIAALALGGGGGGGEKPRPRARRPPKASATPGAAVPISANGIALKVPGGLGPGQRARRPRSRASRAASCPIGGPKGGTIVVGKADKTAANSTLLPGDLRKGDIPEPETVDIGDGKQALLHDGVAVGDKTASVVLGPDDRRRGHAGVLRRRRRPATRSASSMQITEGNVFPIGPDAKFAKNVQTILGRLESREKAAARDLNNAGKRTTQVAATGKLWGAYSGAAKSLSKLKISPADADLRKQMVAALGGAGSAYRKAASEGKAQGPRRLRAPGQPRALLPGAT